MYCWNCGTEVGYDRFCYNCGAEQKRSQTEAPREEPITQEIPGRETPAANYYSTVAQTAPAKKKKGWIGVMVAVAVVLAASLAGRIIGRSMASQFNGASDSSGPSFSSSSIPSVSSSTAVSAQDDLSAALAEAMTDIVTRHQVYVADEGDGVRDFVIIYYGNDTHALTGMTVEYVYEKSFGYTIEDVQNADFSPYFPAFAEFSCSEDDDYVIFTSRMKDLKDEDHLRVMVSAGLITLETDSIGSVGYADADSLMQSFLANGWQEASMVDYEILHFD